MEPQFIFCGELGKIGFHMWRYIPKLMHLVMVVTSSTNKVQELRGIDVVLDPQKGKLISKFTFLVEVMPAFSTPRNSTKCA
jgi:hypothetical protein